MKHTLPKNLLLAALAFALAHVALAADRIELTDGSVVLGKLLSAEAGKFKVETGFAGTIEIAQDKIKSFTTDEAVNVALGTGNAVLGPVQSTGDGIAVSGADGRLAATTDKVTAVWRAGTDSPETRLLKEAAEKAKRRWQYESALAITGRTGSSERFAGALGFKATLESAQDKLAFTLRAEKAEDNGVETANRQLAGVDYSAFFSDKNMWYARTSVEKDVITQIDLRSSTAFGLGRKVIKNDHNDLELRAGVSYLYETYLNGDQFDSPGLDLAFIHAYKFKTGILNTTVSYTPTFEDFANYRVHQETTYEMPLTAALWKLKLGFATDYNSRPQPGVEKLDLFYFTSLILNWK
jgi:hypothetical protein